MRILMVHNEYGRPSGEEDAVRAIAGLLEANGHEVRWFTKSSADIPDTLVGRAKAFFSGIFNGRSRAEMAARLDAEAYDIVQVQNLYPLLSPSVLEPCRARGIPVVMRCPNYRLFCPTGLHLHKGAICEACLHPGRELWCVAKNCEASLPKSVGYAVRNACGRLTGVIDRTVGVFVVLSEFQKRRFIASSINPDRIVIVPNMAPKASHTIEPGTGETVSFVGRLSPEKGISDFVQSARSFPQHVFAVAGDTSGMPEVVEAAPPNVRFYGFLAGDDLETFYRRTRILVCCSVWFEGFPNVITRAMLGAKPVIATRIGALPEIVEDGKTGLLYEPGNVSELVNRIRLLLDHPDLACTMGAAGSRKARTQYSPAAAYASWMSAYERAIALLG